jgi:hypothetical protein
LSRSLQQFYQHHRRLRPSLGRDVFDDSLHRALHQHIQNSICVCTDRASHSDRLSQDAAEVGSVSSNALNSTYEGLDGWKRTVWHVVRIADRVAVRQN